MAAQVQVSRTASAAHLGLANLTRPIDLEKDFGDLAEYATWFHGSDHPNASGYDYSGNGLHCKLRNDPTIDFRRIYGGWCDTPVRPADLGSYFSFWCVFSSAYNAASPGAQVLMSNSSNPIGGKSVALCTVNDGGQGRYQLQIADDSDAIVAVPSLNFDAYTGTGYELLIGQVQPGQAMISRYRPGADPQQQVVVHNVAAPWGANAVTLFTNSGHSLLQIGTSYAAHGIITGVMSDSDRDALYARLKSYLASLPHPIAI